MASKDLLTEEKDEIAAEAEEAFGAEDMVGALEQELASDADESLGDRDDADDAGLGEAVADSVEEPVEEEDEPAEGAATETEGAGPDRGDGRDDKGKFASKEQQDAHDKAAADAKKAGKTPAEQKAAGTAAAAAAKPAAAAAQPAPKWEPYQVKAGKAVYPIAGVKTLRQKDAAGNEHVILAVPAKEYSEFQHRIGRGFEYERVSRSITEKERELEFARTAPRPKSDTEIEAALFVETLKKMPGAEEGVSLLDEIFTPEQLENLKLRVQLAQAKEKTDFAAAETQRRAEASEGETWEKTQTEQLIDQAFDLAETHPELKGMTEDEIRDILQELAMPVRDKIVYRENGEMFANTEYLFKLLKRGRSAPRSPAPASESAPPAATDKKGDGAERFNKGQESAAQPRSTSLRQNRGTRPRPDSRTSRDPVRDPKDDRTPAQIAEDRQRQSRRKMMTSPSLDFDDEDD